MFPTYSKD